MTSKLICPFCGKEIQIAGERTTIMSCFNGDCVGSGLYGEKEMWQALIQAKQDLKRAEDMIVDLNTVQETTSAKYVQSQKDLETARKAFEMIKETFGIEDRLMTFAGQALNMKAIAEKALEQIEHKE